jgi:hypothetical protein
MAEFSLLLQICNGTLDISAGTYVRKQDHPILKLLNAVSLNTFARLISPSWVNPAGASASISKSATRLPPETTPSAPPSYLGRRATLLTKKQRVALLQMGGACWYSGNTSIKEFDKLPMDPQPPPAPNNDLPTKAPPDILPLPLFSKQQAPQPLTTPPHLTATGPRFNPSFLAPSTYPTLHQQFPRYSASNSAFIPMILIPGNLIQ